MAKTAILIDGGYFLTRLPSLLPMIDPREPMAAAQSIHRLVRSHLDRLNQIAQAPHPRSLLHRVLYYDAMPYSQKGHLPISGKSINYALSDEAKFRLGLFECLRHSSDTAVRLGEVRAERGWNLKEETLKRLVKGDVEVKDLTDNDFTMGFRQKAVDMRLGMDIASLALKRQVDTIILVAGDADFVSASKLARREGIRVILDPLWRNVAKELFEHIDGVWSGFRKPKSNGTANWKR